MVILLSLFRRNNDFIPSIPLDVASADGKTIYAANSVNNTLYIFKRSKGRRVARAKGKTVLMDV